MTTTAGSEVRVELAAGVIALAEAIEDQRASSCYVYALLHTIRGVRPTSARRMMFRAGIPELERVRDLTDRQCRALVDELAEEVRNADR